MKKNTLFVALLTLIATTVFTSCEKEKVFVAPVADYLAFMPNPCYEGDTVVTFIQYKEIGAYWYYTKQNYTLDGKSIVSLTKPDGGKLNDHAETKFVAPAPGDYTVTFTSQISIYTGKNNPFAEGPTATSILRVIPKENIEDQDNNE